MREVSDHPDLQKLNQVVFHERIIVRYIKTDDGLTSQMPAKVALDLVAVCALHHEDRIGPSDQFARQWIFRVMIDAGRIDFDPGMSGEDLLRGRAPQAVLTADEEKPLHGLAVFTLRHSASFSSKVRAAKCESAASIA